MTSKTVFACLTTSLDSVFQLSEQACYASRQKYLGRSIACVVGINLLPASALEGVFRFFEVARCQEQPMAL